MEGFIQLARCAL